MEDVHQLISILPKDLLQWSKNGLNKNSAGIITYEYFTFRLLPKKPDPFRIYGNKLPILLVSNSDIVPRSASVCIRSFDEFNQLASLLKPYIRMRNMPQVPDLKKGGLKIEAIKTFLNWMGKYYDILFLTPILQFLYTDMDMVKLGRYFKMAMVPPTSLHPLTLRPILDLPKVMQVYEEPYLTHALSIRELFEYSSLGLDVEMGLDPLQDVIPEESFNEFMPTIISYQCCSMDIRHPDDDE
jgi:hypothetical protein